MSAESRRKEVFASEAYHFIVDLADVIGNDLRDEDSLGVTNLCLEYNFKYRWKVHSKLFLTKSTVITPSITKATEPWQILTGWCQIYFGNDPTWLARFIHYMYTEDYVYVPGGDMSAKRRLRTLGDLPVPLDSIDSPSPFSFQLTRLLPPNITSQQPEEQDEEEKEIEVAIEIFGQATRWNVESLKLLARTVLLARLEHNMGRIEYIATAYPKIHEALECEFDENWQLSGERLVNVLVQYMEKHYPHDPSSTSGVSTHLLNNRNEVNEESEGDPPSKIVREFYEAIKGYTTETGRFAEEFTRTMGAVPKDSEGRKPNRAS